MYGLPQVKMSEQWCIGIKHCDNILVLLSTLVIHIGNTALQSLTSVVAGDIYWLRRSVNRDNGKSKQSNKHSQISITNEFILKMDTYRIYINKDPWLMLSQFEYSATASFYYFAFLNKIYILCRHVLLFNFWNEYVP